MHELRALTWNLFHGRDCPPDRRLLTRRSRLLGIAERDATHVQVNRPLRREFATVLAALAWDVALLQEAPPRWLRPLCGTLGASGASALTARNAGAAARALAAALNPDLIASNEGGSNQLLARPAWRIDEVRRHTLTEHPERRRLLLVRLRGRGRAPLAVANLHASTGARAARDVLAAAAVADRFAGSDPLVFGGDLNVRPHERPDVFDQLARRFGLAPPTPGSIDHLLARGMQLRERPHELPAPARELVARDGRRLRLSDHACVGAAWTLAGSE